MALMAGQESCKLRLMLVSRLAGLWCYGVAQDCSTQSDPHCLLRLNVTTQSGPLPAF